MNWHDRGLAALALLAWAFAGAMRVSSTVSARAPGARDAVWAALFLAFGACLTLALASRGRRALGLTIAQSAIALAVMAAGMPRFEGALLAIVGAQLGLVAPRRVAWAWMAAQAVPLFTFVALTRTTLEAARATAEYTAFAAFAMVLFDLRRREREQRLALARINAELLATRERLVEAARRSEQTRIQRELHDGLGHSLAVLSMEIDRAGSEPSSDALLRARAALDALRIEARAILSGAVAPIDLVAALAALASATPSMRVRVDAEALRDLGPEAAWVVFRCVQEAITNAWKHGRAREVAVTAAARDGALAIRIENDGAPPPASIAPGRGLLGMRDRAAMIGAAVALDHGDRFAVIVSVPRGSGEGR